jgi:predicted transcriptional regulator
MGKTKESYIEKPVPVVDEEDEATLAAIDEGIADAKAGRTVPAEQVRKLVRKWTSGSSTRKER